MKQQDGGAEAQVPSWIEQIRGSMKLFNDVNLVDWGLQAVWVEWGLWFSR